MGNIIISPRVLSCVGELNSRPKLLGVYNARSGMGTRIHGDLPDPESTLTKPNRWVQMSCPETANHGAENLLIKQRDSQFVLLTPGHSARCCFRVRQPVNLANRVWIWAFPLLECIDKLVVYTRQKFINGSSGPIAGILV